MWEFCHRRYVIRRQKKKDCKEGETCVTKHKKAQRGVCMVITSLYCRYAANALREICRYLTTQTKMRHFEFCFRRVRRQPRRHQLRPLSWTLRPLKRPLSPLKSLLIPLSLILMSPLSLILMSPLSLTLMSPLHLLCRPLHPNRPSMVMHKIRSYVASKWYTLHS